MNQRVSGRFSLLAFIFFLIINFAQAQAKATYELECIVDRKLERELEYSRDRIDEMRWSLIIRHHDEEYATISRCDALAPCDENRIDHFEFDRFVNASKYYFFRGQYDVQVFTDGRFIENNGRGTLAFGRCGEK